MDGNRDALYACEVAACWRAVLRALSTLAGWITGGDGTLTVYLPKESDEVD